MPIYWREYFLNYPFGIDGHHFSGHRSKLPSEISITDIGPFAGEITELIAPLSRVSDIVGPDAQQGPVVHRHRGELFSTLLSGYFWDGQLDLVKSMTKKMWYRGGPHVNQEENDIYPALEMIMAPLPHATNYTNEQKLLNPVWDIGQTPYGPLFAWGGALNRGWSEEYVKRKRLYQSDIRTLSRLFNLLPLTYWGHIITDSVLSGRAPDEWSGHPSWRDLELVEKQQWVTLQEWNELEEKMPLLVLEWGSHSSSRGWEHKDYDASKDGTYAEAHHDTWEKGDMRIWLILPPPPDSSFVSWSTRNEGEITRWVNSEHGYGADATKINQQFVNLDSLANRYPVFMLRVDGKSKEWKPTTADWQVKTLRNMINPETMMMDTGSHQSGWMKEIDTEKDPAREHPWFFETRNHNRMWDNTYAIFSLQTVIGKALDPSQTPADRLIPWNPIGWGLPSSTKYYSLWEEAALNSKGDLIEAKEEWD